MANKINCSSFFGECVKRTQLFSGIYWRLGGMGMEQSLLGIGQFPEQLIENWMQKFDSLLFHSLSLSGDPTLPSKIYQNPTLNLGK